MGQANRRHQPRQVRVPFDLLALWQAQDNECMPTVGRAAGEELLAVSGNLDPHEHAGQLLPRH